MVMYAQDAFGDHFQDPALFTWTVKYYDPPPKGGVVYTLYYQSGYLNSVWVGNKLLCTYSGTPVPESIGPKYGVRC